jgi:hypothetical protein
MLITKEELLKVSDKEPPFELEANFEEFLIKINILRDRCGIPMTPTSYYRSINKQLEIYKSKARMRQFPFPDGVFDKSKVPLGSQHLYCCACDFGGKRTDDLKRWIRNHLPFCKTIGLYFEDFDSTRNWCHIQIRPPKSGLIIFKP